MDADIDYMPAILTTNSAAIFRFQYNMQTIWTWSQPHQIPSSAFRSPKMQLFLSFKS